MKKVFASLAALALASAVATAACDVGTTVDEAVITSVTVRAADVTRGLACGTGPGQVFKYTVVTRPARPSADGAAEVDSDVPRRDGLVRIADCFADATFVDPPIVSGTTYLIDIALYDKASYEANVSKIEDVSKDGPLALLPRGATPPGAFGKVECQVTSTRQVQAFASCENASPATVPAQPDAAQTDASDGGLDASDSGDASDAHDGDPDATDAADAGD